MDNQIIINAINDALASRGKNKGMLKSSCPPMNTPGAAAWQAIMGYANPFKVGMCHLILMDEPCKDIYYEIKTRINHRGIDVRGLDRDRKALESIGVW